MQPDKTSIHYARAIAARAKCDPRSVQRYLAGEPVRDSVVVAIQHAIAEAARIDEIEARWAEHKAEESEATNG